MNAIDSSFDDDLLILTFGELGMSEIETGIAKKDCTATSCPLCERQCQAGSTDSGFIANNGACLNCAFGKSAEQLQALLADKSECSEPMPKFDMGSKQDKTITTLACLACGSQFPVDSAQAMAMGQGEGCPTCQIELIAENCSPSRLSEIIKGKLHLSFDKKVLPVLGAMPYMPASKNSVIPTCNFFATSYAKPNTAKSLSAPQAAGTMKLIGIAGQARSGKDTLASYLLNNLSDNWTRSSFADPIKNMLSAIGVDCSDDAKAVIDECFGVTPRHMMQTLGTEWGRNLIDNDIWIKAFARLNAGMCVIVPDVRFENEAELVRQHGVLIHLTGRGGIAGNHVSENPIGFKEGDIVIDNSRDLAWLYAQVDSNAVLSNFVGVE